MVDIRVRVRAYYNLRSVRSDFYVSVSKRKLQVSEISFQAAIIKARKLFEGNLPILIHLQTENFTKFMIGIENKEGHQVSLGNFLSSLWASQLFTQLHRYAQGCVFVNGQRATTQIVLQLLKREFCTRSFNLSPRIY